MSQNDWKFWSKIVDVFFKEKKWCYKKFSFSIFWFNLFSYSWCHNDFLGKLLRTFLETFANFYAILSFFVQKIFSFFSFLWDFFSYQRLLTSFNSRFDFWLVFIPDLIFLHSEFWKVQNIPDAKNLKIISNSSQKLCLKLFLVLREIFRSIFYLRCDYVCIKYL